jgi:hypothetical protein
VYRKISDFGMMFAIYRQEISNEYLVAKIGVDTAENETSKVSTFIPTQAI